MTKIEIEGAGHCALGNPFARALQRVTGVAWYVQESGVASEMTPPCRNVTLDLDTQSTLKSWFQSGQVAPLEFEFDLESCAPSPTETQQKFYRKSSR